VLLKINVYVITNLNIANKSGCYLLTNFSRILKELAKSLKKFFFFNFLEMSSTTGHVSSDRPAAAVVTDALLLQVLGCGTVCQLI